MKYLFLYIFLSLIFFSCKKETGHIIYIPQIYKDVGYFQKDSYWIFKNESTGLVDCTFVNQKSYKGFEPYGGEGTKIEVILIKLSGINFKEMYLDYTFVGLQTDTYAMKIFGISSIIDTIPELQVNDSIYHQVYLNRITREGLSGPLTITSYMVPHIGIVKLSKQELGTDTILTLMRYKVIQ